MIVAGGAAAPRCYLSLASGWLATPPPPLLIYRPPSPIVEKTRYGQILLSERQDATALLCDEVERPSIHGSADNDGTF